MFYGYLELGGVELVNHERFTSYLRNQLPGALSWFHDPGDNGDLRKGLGDPEYFSPLVDGAPWLDPAVPASQRFYGCYLVSAAGFGDDTRTATVVESMGPGGTVGPVRRGTGQFTVSLMLVAADEEAMEAGRVWLSNALDPACNDCDADVLQYLIDVPQESYVFDMDGGFGSGEDLGVITPERSPFIQPWNLNMDDAVCGGYFLSPQYSNDLQIQYWAEMGGERVSDSGPIWLRRTNWSPNPNFTVDTSSWSTPDAPELLATNLLTNPSFEAAGAPVTIATNLLTNPSMETAGSASGVRSNLCTNPRMLTLTGWANGSTGSVTQTQAASGQQYDVTTAVGATNLVTYQTAVITAAPGDLFVTSMQVTVPAGFPAVSLYLDAQEYTPSTGPYARGATVTVQPGQTATVTSGILTVDASGNGFRSVLRFAASTPVGARLIVANCLVEKTASIGFYFDGSSVLDSGLVGAWTSAPDASASVLMATAVTSWTPQNGYRYQSSAQVHSRSKSTACVLNAAVSAGCYTTFTQVIGTVYTLSAWVYSPTAVTMRAAYTNGTVSSGGTATTVPANTWTRLWVTGTAASSTTGFLSILTTVAPPAGTLIYIDDADAVASPVLTDHFDGASAAADDFTYAWTGTADASTSVQQGVAPTETTSGTFAACIASSQWATAGATSLRIIPISTSTNTFSGIGGYQGGFKYGMVAGGTYTMLATARLAGPQGGSLLALARSIAVWVNGTSGWTNIATSPAAPNAAGATDLRVTFTIPAGATGVWIGLYNGASAGNGDVWWDNAALVEGTYTGPAFNGDTADSFGKDYAWTGPADASTSTLSAVPVITREQPTDGSYNLRFTPTDASNWELVQTFASKNLQRTISIDLRADATGTVKLSADGSDPVEVNVNNAWQRVAVPLAASTADTQTFTIEAGNGAVSYVEARKELIEQGTQARAFFDATPPPPNGYALLWLGVPGASPSQMVWQGALEADVMMPPNTTSTFYLSVLAGQIDGGIVNMGGVSTDANQWMNRITRQVLRTKATGGPTLSQAINTRGCGVARIYNLVFTTGKPYTFTIPEDVSGAGALDDFFVVDDQGIVQAVNLAPNPRMAADLTGITFTPGDAGGVLSQVATGGPAASPSFGRVSYSGTGGGGSIRVANEYWTMQREDTPVAASVLVRPSAAFDAASGAGLNVQLYDFNNSPYGDPIFVPVQGTAPANVWTEIDLTGVVPADTADYIYSMSLDILPPQSGITAGATFDFTTIMFSPDQTTVPLYFDGDLPDSEETRYDWRSLPNASPSVMVKVAACPSVTPAPIVDPNCAPIPAPPRPPTVSLLCTPGEDVTSWDRYYLQVEADNVSSSATSVPVLELYDQWGLPQFGTESLGPVRVRWFANPFSYAPEDVDPCSYCAEFIISYLPAGGVLSMDGRLQNATINLNGTGEQEASVLLFGSDGTPMTWPELTCGIPYLMTVDVPHGSRPGGLILDIAMARRE